MVDPKDIEKTVRDCVENNWKLKVDSLYENTSDEDFMPCYPDYPDASKYLIITYDQERNLDGYKIIEDPERKNAVVKRLKEIYGIKDPWDDDPDFIKRKLDQRDVEFEKKVFSNLKDKQGSYYLLKINPACEDVANDEYLPYDLNIPDACRYSVCEYDEKNGNFSTIYLEEYCTKDNIGTKSGNIDDISTHITEYFEYQLTKNEVVKRLKKVHNITDPWDNTKDHFQKLLDKRDEHLKEIYENRENGTLPKCITLGTNQVGERKTEIYLYKEKFIVMHELWPNCIYEDRKVETWTEKIGKNNGNDILQDRMIILQRDMKKDDTAWRLVYQKWNRKYVLSENGEKQWIGAEHNGIEKYEEYDYDDNIKVKFKKKK